MKLTSHDLWLGYVYRYDANLFKNFENVFILKAKIHQSQNEVKVTF